MSLEQSHFEDFINHEVTRMREWNMTTAPALNTSARIPFDHRIPPDQWTARLESFSKDFLLDSHLLIRKSLYSHMLQWWLEYFTPGKDMLVINYQDMVRDTREVYHRILDFSGIPRDNSNKTFGRARESHNFQPMANATRQYLQDFFRPYNAELETLLGSEWSQDVLKW